MPDPPEVTDHDLENDPRWELVQRIVASKSFAKAQLLSRFLLYITEHTLRGETDRITEQQVGVNVFGRRPHYNSAEDNIVRNYARQLRQRLEAYFEEEGHDEAILLSVPRGTYVPVFLEREPSAEELDALHGKAEAEEVRTVETTMSQPADGAAPAAAAATRARSKVLSFVAVVVVLTLAATGLWWWTHRATRTATLSDAFWTQFFGAPQTILVPADDGIVMFQNLTHRSVHLAEYIDRSYMSTQPSGTGVDAQNLSDLEAQRYTSIADLDAVMRLSHLPQVHQDRLVVRYARELHMSDLKDANAVLLGSSFANPWVELFQPQMNFEFSYEPEPNHSLIRNKHPRAGEQEIYKNDADSPSHRTYGVIALMPNLNNTGWVLIVEGLTMAGTQAAVETLFKESAMAPTLRQARDAHGNLRPFEMLIETRSFESSAPQSVVLTTRVYP